METQIKTGIEDIPISLLSHFNFNVLFWLIKFTHYVMFKLDAKNWHLLFFS